MKQREVGNMHRDVISVQLVDMKSVPSSDIRAGYNAVIKGKPGAHSLSKHDG